MRGWKWALVGVMAAGAFAQDDIITASGDNCTFLADRDKFLQHDFRARNAIQARLLSFDAVRPMAATAGPVAPVPRRNFIDDEIFGKLEAQGVASARIAGDEEYFRRVNLDLTGRIPTVAEYRAFVADTSVNKRSALLQNLLVSDAFTDKWTMWLGDLLENNVQSVATTRGVNGRNAFYRFIWSQMLSWDSFQDIAVRALTGTGNIYDDFNSAGWIPNGTQAGGPANDIYDQRLYKATKTWLGLGHYDCLLCHSGRGHLDALSQWGKYQLRSDAEHMAVFFSRTTNVGYTFPPGTPLVDMQANFYYQSQIVSNNTTGSYPLPTTGGNRPNRAMVDNLKALTPVYRDGQKPAGNAWRDEFARMVVNDPMFAVNIVNRVWKEMFNLGLVDAVDALDPDRLDPANPPEPGMDFQATHPVLLRKLANEWAARNYNFRELVRMIAESSAYQLSSRYEGEWSLNYVPLFARHYPRRLMGEEIHDAIARGTGVFTKYTLQGLDPVSWAMQLPDTSEPRASGTPGNQAAAFMNLFLRGNRDNVPRATGSTILQSAGLMNDPFVNGKFHMTQSPTLQAVAKLPAGQAQVEEMYLTFLGRLPDSGESAKAVKYLTAGTTAAAKNAALEDLAWALMNKLEFQFSY